MNRIAVPGDLLAPHDSPEVRQSTPVGDRILILDPTARGRGGDPDPGAPAGPLAGKRILFRVDPLWRWWDWTVDEWSSRLIAAGAKVETWKRYQGVPGQDGTRRDAVD